MKVFIKIIKAIINVILTLIIVVGIAFVISYFAGIEPYVVESGSMEPAMETGSVCFVNKKAKYDSIKVGDIIAFKVGDSARATHRVISITNEGFITKGDDNVLRDEKPVDKDRFIGKTLFSIPKVGYFVKIAQTTKGKIIFGSFILVLFVAGLLLGDSSKKNKKSKSNKLDKNEISPNGNIESSEKVDNVQKDEKQ